MAKKASSKKQYPIVDEHRRHYIHYPVKNEKGEWVAVNVLKKGYQHIINAKPFKKESDCMKACKVHNDYHGWSDAEVEGMVATSMGISPKSAQKDIGVQVLEAKQKTSSYLLTEIDKASIFLQKDGNVAGAIKSLEKALSKAKEMFPKFQQPELSF